MPSLWRALRLLASDPREFRDVLAVVVDTRIDESRPSPPAREVPVAWDAVRPELDACVGVELEPLLAEPALREIETEVESLTAEVSASGPFGGDWNASPPLARLCYAFCRALKPDAVVETGVAYGATSAYLLAAMDVNGRGRLDSIDWTPPAEAEFVGAVVPEHLRQRWQLHRGVSRRLLPRVLRQRGAIGMFISDSSHTYRTMRWELKVAAPHVASGGVLLIDDIESNAAFSDWADVARPAHRAAVMAVARHAFGLAIPECASREGSTAA
jgi:predicted O-methyltransferase YrrM